MNEPSSQTQTGGGLQTQNPQAAGSAPTATQSADFQSTAAPELLRQDATAGSLSVADTGESITAVQSQPQSGISWVPYAGGFVIVIAAAAVLLYALWRSSLAAEPVLPEAETPPKSPAAIQKSAKAKKKPAAKLQSAKKKKSAKRKKRRS